MLAFTDGVTEALTLQDEGIRRGEAEESPVSGRPSACKGVVTRIANELRAWMADAPRHDDLTFIVMKIH